MWKKVAPFQSNYGGNTTLNVSYIGHNRYVVNKRKVNIIMLVMKEQTSLEDYKKESICLMKLYEKELNEFYNEKLNISTTETLIFQGY